MTQPDLSPFLFSPEAGQVIREPLGSGDGWWAGAPGAFYDEAADRFYLLYRHRRPRGVPPDRGGELLLAESEDGLAFRDVWRLTKAELGSASLERACLRRLDGDDWRLWVSYVDPADSRWRIDELRASSPLGFDGSARRPALTAGDLGIEGVKDPWVTSVDGVLHMVVSFAARVPSAASATEDDLHSTADAYDTGLILSHSGLAVSPDGRDWQWQGAIQSAGGVGTGWDGYSARLACVLPTEEGFVGYYDGAYGVANHYDEATSLCAGPDLRHLARLSPDGPLLRAPHGLGCCRYFDAVRARGRTYVYYEFGRPDGSHDLRVAVL